jgi:hypothetical protein
MSDDYDSNNVEYNEIIYSEKKEKLVKLINHYNSLKNQNSKLQIKKNNLDTDLQTSQHLKDLGIVAFENVSARTINLNIDINRVNEESEYLKELIETEVIDMRKLRDTIRIQKENLKN